MIHIDELVEDQKDTLLKEVKIKLGMIGKCNGWQAVWDLQAIAREGEDDWEHMISILDLNGLQRAALIDHDEPIREYLLDTLPYHIDTRDECEFYD